jgi:hypothetical protein
MFPFNPQFDYPEVVFEKHISVKAAAEYCIPSAGLALHPVALAESLAPPAPLRFAGQVCAQAGGTRQAHSRSSRFLGGDCFLRPHFFGGSVAGGGLAAKPSAIISS